MFRHGTLNSSLVPEKIVNGSHQAIFVKSLLPHSENHLEGSLISFRGKLKISVKIQMSLKCRLNIVSYPQD